MIDTILFDGDDTLWDFQTSMRRALQLVLEELWSRRPATVAAGLDIERLIQFRDRVASELEGRVLDLRMVRLASFERTLEEIGHPDPRLAADLTSSFLSHRSRLMTELDGARSMLESLHGRYKLGLVTNGNVDPARFGLDGFFGVVVTASSAGVAKPDPRIFAPALSVLGSVPEQSAYVGDSLEHDVAGARAAGMVSVWLSPGTKEQGPEPVPDFVVRSLAEVPVLFATHFAAPVSKNGPGSGDGHRHEADPQPGRPPGVVTAQGDQPTLRQYWLPPPPKRTGGHPAALADSYQRHADQVTPRVAAAPHRSTDRAPTMAGPRLPALAFRTRRRAAAPPGRRDTAQPAARPVLRRWSADRPAALSAMSRLPAPPVGRPDVVEWVGSHLPGLFCDELAASPRFVGGQTSADAALSSFDVSGYASARNEVWTLDRRGASALSPYIRHGLLQLPRVWHAVADGPGRDSAKFRDELLWQEYSRHLYARMGTASRRSLCFAAETAPDLGDPWDRELACIDLAVGELERDGWLVNQTRMWLASHWAVRQENDWRAGEDRFFTHLLDGSRAANRLGWQWTAGLLTGRRYGFSRHQVEKRAPGLCETCSLEADCPIQAWPPDRSLEPLVPDPRLASDPDLDATAGPIEPVGTSRPAAVWLTAESLGDADPALVAHPGLPAVFVFDGPLLKRVQLSSKRLVFIAECLADLADRRPVEVHLGRPGDVLSGRPVATTFAPVPGWRRLAGVIDPAEVRPWPWLRRPHAGPIQSFSAWRKRLGT